jgi:short-subunit dehydrogenase
VNNAGYGLPDPFVRTTWEQQAALLQVLVTAGAHLAHLVLPGMLERGYGRIVNVMSLAGLLPGAPGSTLYAGAKAFGIKFSESLAAELQGSGVAVTAVCPGFTFSEFHDVNGTREKVQKMPSYLWMDSDEVAREGTEAALRGDVVCVTGRLNATIASLAKVLPASFVRDVVRRRAKSFRNVD